MEKILAFFIPSFFSSLSGGITYKPFLDSSKSPVLFKLLKFRLLTPLKGDNLC